ncbi:GNAT family N-acetyltransferase [Rhizobium grahamii]|uniref:GNAT family N-acetyltransferase n=1 Tax=Rhizobium grahamii TaxID=1120045 RepID=A0A5Q0C2J3_9HYPH|nr:GNAT family N-acetyltransferase [Rhizobium grahamii]QRM51154.1 GNAT family N-acetyltransferase [Rhizobium sp. BG6]
MRRGVVHQKQLHVDHEAQAEAGVPDSVAKLRALNVELAVERLQIELVTSLQAIESEWRALDRDNLNSLHQSYDWCAAWVEAHRRPLAVIAGKAGADTAFILPVEIVSSRGIRIAKFIGADHSNINTGLFAADFAAALGAIEPDRLSAMLKTALMEHADLLLLQNIPLSWRERPNPLTRLPTVQNQNYAYQLPLLENWEATLKQLNAKNRRKKFRVQSKRLEALGGFEYIAGGAPEEQHQLLDAFFAQKSRRFQALGLPDVFSDAETKQFLHGAIDARDPAIPAFSLEMHAIRLKGEHEGHIAALAGISRKGDHVICQFSSIDETIAADASPGEFLFWQMIQRQQDHGVSLFDFGLGDQSYKRSWAPEETAHYDVVLPLNARGAAMGLFHRTITRGKAFVKSHPRLYKVAQRMRRFA